MENSIQQNETQPSVWEIDANYVQPQPLQTKASTIQDQSLPHTYQR